jgi:quinol monooxygenase YgiN
MIMAIGRARFGPGEVQRMQEGLNAHAREVRAMDGNLFYSYAVDLADPQLVHVTEGWRDEEALDAKMEHMATLIDTLAGANMHWLACDAWEARYVKRILGDADVPAMTDHV